MLIQNGIVTGTRVQLDENTNGKSKTNSTASNDHSIVPMIYKTKMSYKKNIIIRNELRIITKTTAISPIA